MRAPIVFAFVLAGCISSPNVSLVDTDASTLAASDADAGDEASAVGASDAGTTEDPDVAVLPAPLCDGRCAKAGGSCAGDVCTFACPGAASCDADIACPPGMPCTVSCVGKEACRNVVCRDATSCAITCDGDHGCNGRVSCYGPSCVVTCANGGCKPDDVRCCASTCTVNGVSGKCF